MKDDMQQALDLIASIKAGEMEGIICMIRTGDTVKGAMVGSAESIMGLTAILIEQANQIIIEPESKVKH